MKIIYQMWQGRNIPSWFLDVIIWISQYVRHNIKDNPHLSPNALYPLGVEHLKTNLMKISDVKCVSSAFEIVQ